MGFSTALSGLSAAAKNLSVTGNNIANANTTGFKKSRAEFADVYAASLGGVSAITAGSGVRVANVAQQFNQGNLNFTDNNLDLGISGEGFFTLAASPTDVNNRSYTRAGEFKLDKDGYIVNNQGQALLAYRPNGTTVADGFSTGVMQPIQINTIAGQPQTTDTLKIVVNLDASKPVAPVATFDKNNSKSYTSQTSATVYDSFGTSHVFTTYFVNKGLVAGDVTWRVYHYIDGNPVNVAGTEGLGTATSTVPKYGELKFDAVGNLKGPVDSTGVVDGTFNLDPYSIVPATGASPIDINTLSYFGSTHFNQKFSVNELSQNGLPAGQLTGIDINDEGVIFARFSNGGSKTLGQVALSRFSNPQGLAKLGDTTWGQNANSGDPVAGQPGSNNFGVIQSGSLEASNVELSKQLVNLIVAQQAYQANAKTITTENTIIQSILNI